MKLENLSKEEKELMSRKTDSELRNELGGHAQALEQQGFPVIANLIFEALRRLQPQPAGDIAKLITDYGYRCRMLGQREGNKKCAQEVKNAYHKLRHAVASLQTIADHYPEVVEALGKAQDDICSQCHQNKLGCHEECKTYADNNDTLARARELIGKEQDVPNSEKTTEETDETNTKSNV